MEGDLLKQGADFDPLLPFAHAAPSGTFSQLTPAWGLPPHDFAELAYCIYRFNIPGYDRNPEVQLTWAVPPAALSDYFVGLANWDRDRWDWYTADGITDPGGAIASLDPYFNNTDDLLLVVAILGTQPVELATLRIGSAPPTASLSVDVPTGIIPHGFTLDAGASVDPEGEQLSYAFDPEGDGTYSTVQNDPTYPALISQNGTYTASVRVTDPRGASSLASVDVHAVGDWEHTWGRSDDDIFTGVAADGAGMLYALGKTSDLNADLLLTKWTPAGKLVWAKRFNSGVVDTGTRLAVDSEGMLAVAGNIQIGVQKYFLLQRWTPDGELLWSKRYGNDGGNTMTDVVCAGTDIYAAGWGPAGGSGDDLVLVCTDQSGNLLWGRYRDASDSDYSRNLSLRYNLFGATGLVLGAESLFAGSKFNFWKVEYDLDGTFDGGAQLGTSAQEKRYCALRYSYNLIQASSTYYISGTIDTGAGYEFFAARTDGTGTGVWGRKLTGISGVINDLGFNSAGELLATGYGGGPNGGELLAFNPVDGLPQLRQRLTRPPNNMHLDCSALSFGVTAAGFSAPLPVTFTTETPAATSLNLSFSTYNAAGGDPGYTMVLAPGTVTDETAAGVLDTGGGGYEGYLRHEADY